MSGLGEFCEAKKLSVTKRDVLYRMAGVASTSVWPLAASNLKKSVCRAQSSVI